MNPSAIPSTFAEHAASLRALRGRERAQRRRELEAFFQVSSSTLSRWLHALSIGTHSRSDKGTRKVQLTHDDLSNVFKLQYSSYKQTQGPIMTAADAIEIAEKNGVIPSGILTASTYNAWLRAQGIARDEVDLPEPHVNLISLGPNHVHQVDFSLAINWKIKNNRAVYDELVYKNKLPASGEPRLLRLVLTDHTSGAFFVWYTAAPGESLSALIEGLWMAWTEKRVDGNSVRTLYPLRGVPRILMMDRGPGSKSQILRNLLDHLQVSLNICEGPRSKGQVESAHWWWEQRFESRFRLDPVIGIDKLNDEAVAFAAKLCKEKVHSRTGATRTAHWEFHINRGYESQLRVPNCAFSEAKRFAVSPAKLARVSGSGIVEFRGNKYRVPEGMMHEKQVSVQYSPFEFPNVYVKTLAQPDAPPFVCVPLIFNEHGFPADGVVIGSEYKRHAFGDRARAVSEAKRSVKEYVAEGRKIVTRGYHLEGLEASGIKSRETALEVTAENPVYSAERARAEVIDRVGRPLEAAEKRLFLAFDQSVTEDEVTQVVQRILDGVRADVVSMAVGVGR